MKELKLSDNAKTELTSIAEGNECLKTCRIKRLEEYEMDDDPRFGNFIYKRLIAVVGYGSTAIIDVENTEIVIHKEECDCIMETEHYQHGIYIRSEDLDDVFMDTNYLDVDGDLVLERVVVLGRVAHLLMMLSPAHVAMQGRARGF